MVMVLTLSGCWFMGLEGVIERKLEERYEMSFRVIKMLSINDNGPELRRRALVHPVEHPDLEFEVFISKSHQLEDRFLDYYGEYRVAQFFQQLADEVGLDAVVQGIGNYSFESQGPTTITRPLQEADPVYIIKNNPQWVYINYVLIRVSNEQERQEALEKFHRFLALYHQRYTNLPKVVFCIAIGDAQQVAEAEASPLRKHSPSRYHYIFRRPTFDIVYENGISGKTSEELTEYFLADPPAVLPPFEKKSQEGIQNE